MLVRDQQLWLIDHGAALYVHHTWTNYLERSRSAFPQVKDHVLLRYADALPEADLVLRLLLTPELIESIIALIPDSWLDDDPSFSDRDAHRAAYVSYLLNRLAEPRTFVEEALDARAKLV